MLRLARSNRLVRLQPNLLGFRGTNRVSLSAFSTINNNDVDAALRDNVKNLGAILGESVKLHDPSAFEKVEKLRKLGRQWRNEEDSAHALQEMIESVKSYDANQLLSISRAFSNFLALANSAENHHRIRRLRASLQSSGSQYGLWPKEDSTAGSISKLLKSGISKDSIFKALTTQKVEIVLTAHPTEVNRRTMLRKHRRIKEILEQQDRHDLSHYERRTLQNNLKAEITSIWASDNLRRSKPTPTDEARSGLAIVENVLWEAIPNFLRKLDDVIQHELQVDHLPLTAAPIKIGSWMGGDRDGNPNVTPEITFEVSLLSRWVAATLYLQDIKELRASLSMQTCSTALKQHLLDDPAYATVVDKKRLLREPYREVLKTLESRLQATKQWIEKFIFSGDFTHWTEYNLDPAEAMKNSSELMQPLTLLYDSLHETGMHTIANGLLLDTLRRISTFGLTLLPLDIRQESTKHSEALNAITQYLGLGSYLKWDEHKRREWLCSEIISKRPLLPHKGDYQRLGFSPDVIDTLRTFDLISVLGGSGGESLNGYVISQCQQASDVLAVVLLQQESGVSPSNLLRVVPLFETLDDLERSAETIESLFSMPQYVSKIKGKQEIMVGYSDSAKDAGRFAASWAQYISQTKMNEIAEKYNLEVTFFHGKGGTVGRGGNPALFQAILAHPPNTIHGRFRVTEQGEMITQNLGQVPVAERTLDLFTAGVLAERFIPRPDVQPEWQAMMERLAVTSCQVYRQIVREEPRFVPYFRTATPELELAGLNVGSRPAKRNPKGGVESLRAIPWNFAWTQTRLNLPTWLGVGEALALEMQTNPEVLQDMVSNWPWFATLIDLLEMILVKSDIHIAANYDQQLVRDSDSLQLGQELREKMKLTIDSVLQVSGNQQLQQKNHVLLRSLTVRNPYIDPLNVIQAELLKRLRALNESNDKSEVKEKERQVMQDALLITINGIANGMRNSG
jgi:phosphoenolpyruvate carboxylase